MAPFFLLLPCRLLFPTLATPALQRVGILSIRDVASDFAPWFFCVRHPLSLVAQQFLAVSRVGFAFSCLQSVFYPFLFALLWGAAAFFFTVSCSPPPRSGEDTPFFLRSSIFFVSAACSVPPAGSPLLQRFDCWCSAVGCSSLMFEGGCAVRLVVVSPPLSTFFFPRSLCFMPSYFGPSFFAIAY